jgi:hypothetical protein
LMPTSSVSGMLSTSAYFAAVFLLMAVVMGPVANLSRGVSLEAAGHLAQGIATQVDNLSPGMKTMIEFGSYPGMDASVTFSGSNVTAIVNGFSATQRVDVQLASCKLEPGKDYQVLMNGGVVELA